MLQYLKVGQIINTHGIKGELKIYPLTDDISRFNKLKHVFLNSKWDFKKYEIEEVKYFKNLVILKFKGIDDMNEALNFIKEYIYVDRESAVKLPKNTYFIADLIGLDVYTVDNERLGVISSVFSTGSNDVYEIKNENEKSILIPAIKDVIIDVDIENKKIIIKLLEGLI